ncbi:MAG: GAF domain-containing protein, partial [Cyanobacteria bacterium J06607_13]
VVPSDGALVEAISTYTEAEGIEDALKQDARTVLQTQLELNQLDYVAIVSPDFRMIANTASDRSGELFNPNNLVSSAIRQSEPKSGISSETLVSLQQLGLSVPNVNTAALVQYAVTPVFEGGTPTNKSGVRNPVIGALVTGDILDNESPVVTRALTNFSQGYSEIYLREPGDSFELVAISEGSEVLGSNSSSVSPNFNFLNQTMQAAADQPNSIVTEKFSRPNGEPYTVAATAIVDADGQAIGVIQRDISTSSLNRRRWQAFCLLLGATFLALLADVIIAKLLGRSIVKPLRNLQAATEKFASGDRSARADVFARDEVGRVASAFNELAAAVSSSESSLRFQSETQSESARRAKLLSALTSDIRRTLEEEAIFSTSVERAREVLEVDRVLVYRFNADYTGGTATAESVGKGWSRAQGQVLEDPMLPDSVDRFKSGQVSTVENIETENLTECHCRLLRELDVKANMVAPIMVGDDLVGLLCAHQCGGPRQWQPEEINMIQQISTQIGFALSQARLLASQRVAVKREQQLSELVTSIRETSVSGAPLSEIRAKIFRLVTRQTKLAIESSRVVVYLFDETWKGTIVAESVDPQWPPALSAEIADPCFADRYVEQYRTGRVKATTDVYNAGLTPCHLGQLEPYQVKANLVAPIVVEDKLLGLLIAHECSGPREWSDITINFIQRAATQLGFALEQAVATTQKEAAMVQAKTLAEELTQRQEALQMQLVDLLSDVESAADGDLTVRADVTAGEIGTVADFFNAIVENLSQVVTQVKASAMQVNDSLGKNEGAIRVLASEAEQQAAQTTRTLASVGSMTTSIQQVAQQAQEAAAVAKTASETATLGGEAMELTVSNIMSLRQTVGQTAKKVKRLGESSQQITKAVLLINQISQQTNLLAINAGIEAARAGEDGQGFAAVAEEVSELASRSASATEEIERIVEAIQRETGDVVEAIEQSTSQVVEGTRRVEDAKASLTQILSGSQKMDELARQISEATSSQVATSSTVSALMEEIAQLAQRTSESSQQVAKALDETLSVSQSLQSQVATFVVSESGLEDGAAS